MRSSMKVRKAMTSCLVVLLDLVDARGVLGVEVPGAAPAVLERLRGGDARLHHALQRGELHVAPAAQPGRRVHSAAISGRL